MDIEIRKLAPNDLDAFTALLQVFSEAFEMDDFELPDQEHLRNVLNKPDFFVLVASHENKIVGGLTVHVLHSYYTSKPQAYVYDVAVLNEYQRRGIGKKLMAFLIHYCRENGFDQAYVEAETEDSQAVNFYRSTTFHAEMQATHFTYLLHDTLSR